MNVRKKFIIHPRFCFTLELKNTVVQPIEVVTFCAPLNSTDLKENNANIPGKEKIEKARTRYIISEE